MAKISVSLPDEDVVFLDREIGLGCYASRSAALHEVIGAARARRLAEEYGEAFDEWKNSEDANLWDETTGDGLGDDENTGARAAG